MMLGALTSRITGFARSSVVVAALGAGLTGDVYAVANTLPNIVFMLLIGGTLNSVLVPELVRAAEEPVRGAAFTDRVVTACLVLLLALTAAAVVAAPWLAGLYAPDFTGAQRDATAALARLCLPQIFFYGVFGLLGQVLAARERPGAMMWAPVVNNLIVIGVFGLFLATAGEARGVENITDSQWTWLGVGSTVGIVAQAAVLVPFLNRSGYRWRPRFDWRHAGLTAPLKAAGWALLLIAVSQAAFWAVTVLATGVSERAATEGVTTGVGLTAYNNAYQLWIVPQGVIAVSLVTAALPALTRAAHSADYTALAAGLVRTVRGPLGVITLASLAFLLMGEEIAALAYGYGTVGEADVRVLGHVLAAFALGLPAFCVQYALTRGFYALGDARTPVLLTLLTAGANAALAAAAARLLPVHWAVTGMAAAHTLACLLGAAATDALLRRRLRRPGPGAFPGETFPGSEPPALGQLGTHLRVVVACLPGVAAALAYASLAHAYVGEGWPGDLVLVLGGCLLLGTSLLVLSRPLGVTGSVGAVTQVLGRLLRRSRPRGLPPGRH
ncbi:murein biosynthesis integral membrane protein MurJ [Streptomyces sp. CB02009]|uniref:murein biosynthesis integral membrane protein MurJ n=1 Tax=Streptomyces sp. CB02009 TaxID=1703938 RepID=UPI0009A0E17C|nr:murein biosynthesis integral membrane protein MurJ [Streptomyces sp. CB02009]